VENEGAKFIVVGTSSGVALAMMEYVKTQKVVLGVMAGADSITGSACNKNSFRWQVPTYGAIREVVPRIIDKFNASTFYTITPDYVFGHDLLRNTEEVLKEKGKKLLGNAFHPMGETEYSQYITKAMAAKPLIEKLITLGKENSLAARRRAFQLLQDHKLVRLLFADIAVRFNARSSGYTRILGFGSRRGDNASMVILELTEIKKKEPKKHKKEKEEAKPDKEEKRQDTREKISEEKKPKTETAVAEKEKPPISKKPDKKFLGGLRNIFKKKSDSL